MLVGRVHGREFSAGGLRLPDPVVAPADSRPVGPQCAVVHIARRDLAELAGRGVELPVSVEAPAGDGAVRPQPAVVPPARADGQELAVRGADLAAFVVAPASDGVVASDRTSVPHPAVDRLVGRRGGGFGAILRTVQECGHLGAGRAPAGTEHGAVSASDRYP